MKNIYFVKAVIFDMDGVITHTMPDHYRAWKTIMIQEGVQVTHFDIYSREGQPGQHSVKELFEKYGVVFSTSRAKAILARKEKYFKKIVRNRFIRGARSFLRSLYKQNFTLALVTGTAHHELRRILPASLHKLFSVVVTGDQVKHGKPHPEPFLKAIKLLDIKPREAVVIENAPFGIKSAKRAGLVCLAIETSLKRKHLKWADKVFSSIKELQQKVHFRHLSHEI